MSFEVDFNELPIVRNVAIMQGDTYRQPYQIFLNDEPLNLSGAAITVAIRRRPGRGQVVVRRQLAADDALDGKFTVEVPAEETEKLLGEYYYEVEIDWPAGSEAFPDGCTKTVLAGAFVVRDDVLD